MPESPAQARRERIARAEALLDQWLDLFEINLRRAREAFEQSDGPVKLPDVAKLTDLANVFTITRRAYEVELLAQRVAESTHDRESHEMDLRLLLDAIREDSEGR